MKFGTKLGWFSLAVAIGAAMPALAQGNKPLRFVPHANLTALDPVWTTATVTILNDEALPQLVLSGAEVKMPPSAITFKQAEREKDSKGEQDKLF